MKKSLLLFAALLVGLMMQAKPIATLPGIGASTPKYTFNSATGALTLNWGEFNRYDNWDYDVMNTAVKSVTATSEVSFTDDCSQLFYNFNHCESMDLSRVNTSGMINASRMFRDCSSLTTLDLSDWNTANVTSMTQMFYGCKKLTSLNLSGWNTSNVMTMGSMFSGCSSLTSLDLSGFNPASAIDMSYMFYGCERLTSLNVSGWNNTTTVNDMQFMFSGCKGLTTLDISSWNTANLWYMTGMFANCSGLRTIYAGEGWTTDNVFGEWGEGVFTNCTALVGGMGTAFDGNHTDKTYACIDGGPSAPGYFTAKSDTPRGDVNGDNRVNIDDVTALIDYLLSSDASAISMTAADCDLDGSISITDITALIDYLLSGRW